MDELSPAEPPALHYQPSLALRLSIRWARATRWEFWPSWLFYIPVVAYILWLGVRVRSPTAFTAANPGFAAGGVVGESKTEALAPLQANAPDTVARFETIGARLNAAARIAQARRFVSDNAGYPVILKPDIGCRGRGVAVIRNDAQLCAYLQHAPGDVLVQRYIDGEEFGVFVYREPGSGEAVIYSITHKCFPALLGDGQRTLAELIAADGRARLIAPLLWQRFAARLQDIPACGERLALVEIGAHCRGSLFLDASHLATPALRATLERVFAAIPGFRFGRLDLRCPSAAALSAGENLRVLEVNGVTAEAAHIYHPGTPLRVGYASILRQWRIAFAIGAEQARHGAAVTSTFDLLRLFREDLRRGKQGF